MNPQEFAIPACSYALIKATAFPALTDGIYPPTIIDHCRFSPLMDMRYGLAWRLHCDQVFTITTGPSLQSLIVCFVFVALSLHRSHNLCQLNTCIAAKRCKREKQRLHIDLGEEPWRSKPEAYWQPVVRWL
jgi:hypothetical protein